MQSVAEAGPLVLGHGVLLVGGLLWAAVCAVLLAMRWKVPPIVATAPLLAQALYSAGGAMWVTREGARFGADPSQSAALTASAVAQQLGLGSASVAALPIAAVLIFGGLAGGVRGRRGFGAPAFALLLGLVAAALPLAGILQHGSLPFALGRAVLYGLAAVPVALALLGAHPQDNSRESGLVATVSFAAMVMSVEVLYASQQWTQAFAALAGASPESKKSLVEMVSVEIGSLGTLGWVAFALASGTAVIALLRPAADLTDEEVMAGDVSPSGARWLGGALALVVPLAWAAARLATDPSALLLSIAR